MMAVPHSGQNRFAQAAVKPDISIHPPVHETPYPCSEFRENGMKKAAVDFPPSLLFVIQYVAGQGSRFCFIYAAFRYPAMHFADFISRTLPQAGTPLYNFADFHA